MNKLPIYYHIPKCGGTYVITKCREILRYHNNGISVLFITNEKDQVLCRCFTKNIQDNRKIIYSNDCLASHMKDVLFIVIEPAGIKLRDNLLYNIDIIKYQFMTIRHPFDRAQSMYNYITSEASRHEPSHNTIKDQTFEEYMQNANYEKNWISSQFSIEKETLVNKLKDINIYKIHDIEKGIKDCFRACYPDIDCSRYNVNQVNIHRNSVKPKKISIENMPNEIIEKFLEYNKFDMYIYNQYSNRN